MAIGLLGVFLGSLQAAPPANDACAGAYIVPSSGPWPYLTPASSLLEATRSPNDPVSTCQTNVSRSVWYIFVPAQTGFYSLSTCASGPTVTTEADTVLGVFRAASCTGPFTEVSCADDTCEFQASLIAQLTANLRYYILVWQFGDGTESAGAVQLRVAKVDQPTNDTCATAQTLQLNIPAAGSTTLAVNNYQLSSGNCFSGIGQTASTAAGGDVVYRFVAPTAGMYSFRVYNFLEQGDLVVYLAETCPGGAAPANVSCLAAANRSQGSSAEEVVCVSLTAGQAIYVFVDQKSAGIGSKFEVVATRCTLESEPNDTIDTPTGSVFEVTGWVPAIEDWDVYSLGSLGAGQRVFAMVDGESANSTDFLLRVMTETADVLEYDDSDNDLSYGNSSPNIAGAPLLGGPTFLTVTYDGLPGFTGSGPYRLYAVVQPPYSNVTQETEPNNFPAFANRSLNNYFGGTLSVPQPSTDQDYFAFDAVAGDLLFLSLDADPTRDGTPMDARLALLDPAGRVMIEVDDGNYLSNTNRTLFSKAATSPRSPGEALIYRAAQTGLYYARVAIATDATSGIDGAGDYVLSITRNCVPGSANEVGVPVIEQIQDSQAGMVYIQMAGTPGASYRLEQSQDMVNWTTGSAAFADAQGNIQFGVSPGAASMFYRAVSP